MSYVFWLSLGLILAVSEFVVPGFVIIFFGAGALVTGVLKLLWSGLPDSLALLVFTLSSLGALLLFRKTWAGGKVIRDGNTKDEGDVDESCVGRKVSVVEAIAPGKAGKVELNGANWTAESDESLETGASAVVTERHGLTLIVKAR
ncbi:MAG: NfeD family protein [Kiritimatiellae bacterium]|nr:NfeD family protein [Kiritimatiellia bacterium]